MSSWKKVNSRVEHFKKWKLIWMILTNQIHPPTMPPLRFDQCPPILQNISKASEWVRVEKRAEKLFPERKAAQTEIVLLVHHTEWHHRIWPQFSADFRYCLKNQLLFGVKSNFGHYCVQFSMTLHATEYDLKFQLNFYTVGKNQLHFWVQYSFDEKCIKY